MPGPAKGSIKLTQEHRDKISKSKILSRLISHAEGDEDMKQTEVTAAIALLKKVLPDMTENQLTGAGGEALTINVVQRKRGPTG